MSDLMVGSLSGSAGIGVKDLEVFRKKMYLLLHPDKNRHPAAGAAFAKFRRETGDLLARLTRMPLYPSRLATRLQLVLKAQLEERAALQETVSRLTKRLHGAEQELRDAKEAWDAAQDALPASARKARPVIRADSSQGGACHRCGGPPCPLTQFWCATCSRQLTGR